MKKILALIIAAVAVIAVGAQVNITRTGKVQPTDEIFMDMATTVATTAVAQGNAPCGAVIIYNGAFKSTGMASDSLTAEQEALVASRRTTLSTASIYTVNQPTTAAVTAMRRAKITKVYYVNDAEAVIAAGLYTAADYAPAEEQPADSTAAGTTTTLPAIQLIKMDYKPASDLLK